MLSSEWWDTCDIAVLMSVHRQVEPWTNRLIELHSDYTSGRHYEVVELISVFHVDMLARSLLRLVESLRLTLSIIICPNYFEIYSTTPLERDDLFNRVGLVRSLDDFLKNVNYLGSGGGLNATTNWQIPEEELRDMIETLEHFANTAVVDGLSTPGLLGKAIEKMKPSADYLLNGCLNLFLVVANDMSTFFSLPGYVADEMKPLGFGSTPEIIRSTPHREAGALDIFLSDDGGPVYHPDFMRMMRDPQTVLLEPDLLPELDACSRLPPAPSFRKVAPAQIPKAANDPSQSDVSGVKARRGTLSALELLNAISRTRRLSNLFISIQVGDEHLDASPECGSTGMMYNPTLCLLDQSWAGYFFEMNPLPPLNLTLTYTGNPIGRGVEMYRQEVLRATFDTLVGQWGTAVSVAKSLHHHSPDVLFVSPLVGNCEVVDNLIRTGMVHPKIVYVPVNPLEPPPYQVVPDFVDWWEMYAEAFFAGMRKGVPEADAGLEAVGGASASVWLAQCSLSSAVQSLRASKYVFLHLELTYAVFLWRPLFVELFGDPASRGLREDDDGGLEPLMTAWMRGWQCSPQARYLFDLELRTGGPATVTLGADLVSDEGSRSEQEGAERELAAASGPSRAEMLEFAAAMTREAPTAKYFLERRSDAAPFGRGRCADGLCECFPPWRGPMCEHEDPHRVEQRLRGVLHYLTAETERDLKDLSRSLSTLWTSFNKRFDYPVVVFHEGLSLAARRRIIASSENRVWFGFLPRFKEIPKEWAEEEAEVARDFKLGYRAMIRWRSGPMFLEPALAIFDYAMTLDTDSYFPADFDEDPFDLLRREDLVAAFPHLGRESAAVVVNFMHHCLLYSRLKGLNPHRTRMLQAVLSKLFKWHQQCLMLDMEVVRLDWFRGDEYQDFFRYMDATGGFWLYRWGNNPMRTFAVGLLLNDDQVRELKLPYAHQDFCSCGPEAPQCQPSETVPGEFFCEPAERPSGILSTDLAEGFLWWKAKM